VRQAEGELHVGDGTGVGARRRENIRILPIQGDVAGAGIGSPFVVPGVSIL
jgi:hypothetical protein